MQHSCTALVASEWAMGFPVKDAQKPIAAWMRDMMDRYNLTASRWAAQARVAKNTVTRAISENYEHVTSTSTLVKLASVLGEPIPVTTARQAPIGDQIAVDTLVQILDSILETITPEFDATASPEVRKAVALAFRDTLAVLAVEPEAAADPAQARLVARSLAHRQQH